MAAANYAITIEEGATFNLPVAIKANGDPVNLTNHTAQMQVRSTLDAQAVIVEASTANGRIVITGNTGIINITIPANVTSTLDFTQAVYDLKGTSPSGVVTRYLSGLVTFSKAVTR